MVGNSDCDLFAHSLKWLCKLGYEYKNLHKDIFVNEHEQFDIVEDCKNFLKMEQLKPYMVELEENGVPNCAQLF